jgi:signal transduction histidine kinase
MNPPWRTSIGGPNAISWPAFWAVLVASVFISLPDRYTTWNDDTWWRNLLCIVAAVTAMFAIMWLLKSVFMRDAAVQPRPWRALVIFAAGAIVRALVLAGLLPVLGEGDARTVFRVVSSLLVMVPVLVLTASVVAVVRTGATRRATLQERAEELIAAERESTSRTAELQEGAVSRVRDLLLGRLTAMRGGAAGVSDGLREDVEQVIRPMSHRMAADDTLPARVAPAPDRGRVAWGEVLRSATLGAPFRPAALAGLVALGAINALASMTGGPARGIAYTAALWAMTFVIFTVLARGLTPTMRRMGTGARTATFLVASAGGLIVAALLLGSLIAATGGDSPWRIPIAVMLLGPCLACALAIDQGYRQQVAASEADLAASNARLHASAALSASVLWHEERRLARALHGPVQAAVTAAAMRLEAGDAAGAEGLLEDALGHLDFQGDEQQGVDDALTDIAAAWDGLCEVASQVPPDLAREIDAHPPLASAFIDICTEACSNAVRHGGAEAVQVRAVRAGASVKLVVSDDGAPSSGIPISGLGTAMLDDVTLEWHRRREGPRTVLRATLPLAGA